MDQVEEVKRKSDIVSVVGAYVALKKAGRNHKGLCPFHAEKTPSFTVNEELGLYKCFGCGAGGDVIKFVMEIEGIEFVEALQRLAEKVGVKIEFRGGGEDKRRKEMLDVMDLAARYYHYLLTEHPQGKVAKKYLKERKLSEKIIETFNIGFALPEWDGLIRYLTGKKGYKEDLLESCGLVNRKGNHFYDKFRGRVMFPLQDPAGKVIGFTGRILPELAGKDDAKYMNSPETELYHKGSQLYGFYQAKQQIREKKQAVIVEGQMDLISSYTAGVGETVAVGGTALTEEQIEMLARLSNKIILAMDADTAGTAAVKKSVHLAEKRGLSIKVALVSGGKDPDEIARENPKAWKEIIDKAVNIYEFIIKKSLEKYPEGTDDRIKRVAEETIPYIAKIDHEMERDRWMRKLANSLGIGVESVRAEVEKVRMGLMMNFNEKKVEEVKETKIEWLLILIGWLMLSSTELAKEVKKWFSGLEFAGGEGKALVWILNNKEDGGVAVELERMPEELKGIVREALMMKEMEEKPEKKTVLMLSGKILRDKIEVEVNGLQQEIERAEKEGRTEMAEEKYAQAVKLNKKFNEITSILA